jgi:hypothetical protein
MVVCEELLVSIVIEPDQRKKDNVCRVPPSAYNEPPTIRVTFLPAKSESSPDARAPTRAPMENTDTIAPYSKINVNVKFYGNKKKNPHAYQQCTCFHVINTRSSLIYIITLRVGDTESLSKS